MSRFNEGDKVIINGALVAMINTFDEENDRIVYVANVGGGTDTVYAHISQTRVEPFPGGVEVVDTVAQAAPTNEQGDELTAGGE